MTYNQIVNSYVNKMNMLNLEYINNDCDFHMESVLYENDILYTEDVENSINNAVNKKRNIILRIVDGIISFINKVVGDIGKMFNKQVESDFNNAPDVETKFETNPTETLSKCESTLGKVVGFLKPGFTTKDEEGNKKFSPLKTLITGLEATAAAAGTYMIAKKSLPTIKEKATKILNDCKGLTSKFKEESFEDKMLKILEDKNKTDDERIKAAKALYKNDPEMLKKVNELEKEIKANRMTPREFKQGIRKAKSDRDINQRQNDRDYRAAVAGMAMDGKNWKEKQEEQKAEVQAKLKAKMAKVTGTNPENAKKESWFARLFGKAKQQSVQKMNDQQMAAEAISQTSKYAADVLRDATRAILNIARGKSNKSDKDEVKNEHVSYYNDDCYFDLYEYNNDYIDYDIDNMITNL